MSSGATTSTKRGAGSCPQCHSPYNNRYKPPNCTTCNYSLGGSYVQKKKARLSIPECTSVVLGETAIYSVKTSSHDDRSLVVLDNNAKICHQQECKDQRAVFSHSKQLAKFECKHLSMVKDFSQPLAVYNHLPTLDAYPCDDTTKAALTEGNKKCGEHLPVTVKVSPTMYCVFGKPTANNPVGYCHVRVTETTVRCCSKDCKTMTVKSKQMKSKYLCIHVHLLLCLGIVHTDLPSIDNSVVDEYEINNSAADNQDQPIPENLSCSNTIELNMKRSLPNTIPKEIIREPGVIDSVPVGWPDILEPSETTCSLCNSPLGEGKAHHGSRGKSYLLTELNPFKEIKVLVKICTNPKCSAMHQIFPYEFGMYFQYPIICWQLIRAHFKARVRFSFLL